MLAANSVSKTYRSKTRTGLFKSVRQTKVAAKDISIQLPKGKIIGVLGENGAGKTTLIKMLTTLLIPDSGKITIDEEDINGDLRGTRKRINMIAGGERNIYWRLTALENLKYFGSLYELTPEEIKQRSEELLKQFGLWDKKDLPVELYSKGMKQRLQIAKGLINDPEYIFLDEPTLGLDVQIARDLRQNIKELAQEKNKGILLTTHYMEEAEELCDYIYIIEDGKIVMEGEKDTIFRFLELKKKIICQLHAPNSKVIEDKIANLDVPCVVSGESQQYTLTFSSNELNLQDVVLFFQDKDIQLENIQQINPKLEDALIEVKRRKGRKKNEA